MKDSPTPRRPPRAEPPPKNPLYGQPVEKLVDGLLKLKPRKEVAR